MKRALIVTALARFTKSFLTNDIITLQKMGYEVHCAANINHAGAECMPAYFEDMNVVFHQIDFSSSKPVSFETLKSYNQLSYPAIISRLRVQRYSFYLNCQNFYGYFLLFLLLIGC